MERGRLASPLNSVIFHAGLVPPHPGAIEEHKKLPSQTGSESPGAYADYGVREALIKDTRG